MNKKLLTYSIAVAATLVLYVSLTHTVSAHEVYVLSKSVITHDISIVSPNPFDAARLAPLHFLEWACIVIAIISLSLIISLNHRLITFFSPFLQKIKRYAPFIGRLTLGISLLTSGYFHSFFGPELPQSLATHNISFVSALMIVAGFLVVIGLFTRAAALAGIVLFCIATAFFGTYMLTYANYLGELLLSLILGGSILSIDTYLPESIFDRVGSFFEQYGFLILRIAFGIALFFASFYAKFLHSELILDTINDYHLTNYFHFTPLFFALGTFLIEAILGACFFFGFQIRFAALFFTVFLTLSLTFFGEVVWPHIILFGVNFALFFHGYDKYTVGYWLARWSGREGEPVL